MYYKHLKSVLSKYGCNRILEDASKFEFINAPVDFYGISEVKGNIRNNERAEFEHMLLAEYLHHKIKVADNYNFPNKINGFDFEKVGSHFRLYKYSLGQFFRPHKDGHILDGELESQVTVLVYLNDTEAGETVLMPNGPRLYLYSRK